MTIPPLSDPAATGAGGFLLTAGTCVERAVGVGA